MMVMLMKMITTVAGGAEAGPEDGRPEVALPIVL